MNPTKNFNSPRYSRSYVNLVRGPQNPVYFEDVKRISSTSDKNSRTRTEQIIKSDLHGVTVWAQPEPARL